MSPRTISTSRMLSLPTKKAPLYKSEFERKVAAKLKKLRRHHFRYELVKIPYVLEHTYNPDWTSIRNGTILEVKGYLDSDDRRKMLAVKAQHPNLRIVFLFMKPHQKMPKMKTTHAEWAAKKGFEWCTLETLEKYI